MAVDNVPYTTGEATFIAASRGLDLSGDTSAQVQVIQPVHLSGSEGSWTLNELFFNTRLATNAYGQAVRQVPVSTPYHLVTLGSTNLANIVASTAVVRSVHVFNNTTYPIHVKFHNTTATPTIGVGVVWTVSCQAGKERDVYPPGGVRFGTGLGISVTKLLADGDTTAVLAGDGVVDVYYE